MIHHGDCLDVLPTLPADSCDACVTDPPYDLTANKGGGAGTASVNLKSPAGRARVGTGFMGMKWDATGVAFRVETWQAVLRVLKPGAHLAAFGHSRTYHRMACAIEDAGFEIRDSIDWLYGSGFPKSLDVSKAIDKAAGAERETKKWNYVADGGAIHGGGAGKNARCPNCDKLRFDHDACQCPRDNGPQSAAAKQWQGWGTALKPAKEPIVLARKPLRGTVASNVLAHGTGGINVDGCRIESVGDEVDRWPSNVLLDDYAAAQVDAQAGFPASLFFYCAKPSREERDMGCDDLPMRSPGECTDRSDGSAGLNNPRAGAGRTGGGRNYHPTVKPVALMRWLVRLVTPPGGTVLDPFVGSGTTGMACAYEQASFVGIELNADYIAIAERRIAAAAPLFGWMGGGR